MAYYSEKRLMKILVTGAAGLLGSALCNHLHSQGHYVVAVDDFSRGQDVPNCGEFNQGKIQDFEFDTDYDVIYHMGAVNGTDNFYNFPTQTLLNNLTADIKMYEVACACANLQKFVYASTSELVYASDVVPTPETSKIHFENVHHCRWSYSLPKLCLENLLVNSELPWLIVRYFNVYGKSSKDGHFVHDQIEKIKNNEFDILGANETRSFCYIDDAVSATCALTESAVNEIVNVGNDQELSVLDATNIIADALGKNNPNWNLLPGREYSAKRRCPDLTLLRKYVPGYDPIDFFAGIAKILR